MSDNVPDEILDQPTVIFASGELIITEGRKPSALYFLDTGSVEIFKRELRVARESKRGASFGEMAILLDLPATATVKASVECRCFAVADGSSFLQSYPHILYAITVQLAERLEAITRYVADAKAQFHLEGGTHFEMVDSVVETLMVKSPRRIPRVGRGH
jgi:CRP-like cAMP-binding protein